LKPLLAAQTGVTRNWASWSSHVRGDIHDIGKDIVGFMLEVNGFEVFDLGIDQPEETFVKAVKEHKPKCSPSPASSPWLLTP